MWESAAGRGRGDGSVPLLHGTLGHLPPLNPPQYTTDFLHYFIAAIKLSLLALTYFMLLFMKKGIVLMLRVSGWAACGGCPKF